MKQNVFGGRLSSLFESAGYRRERLARYLGVTVSVVRRWENGVSYPNVYQFRGIAAFFNLPYDWFLDSPAGGRLPETWELADRLGLSEGTVEHLMELAQNQPGEVLDALDDAVYALVSAVEAGQEME